jgi:hypothetical protein
MHFASCMRTWRVAPLYSVRCTVQWNSSISETVQNRTHVQYYDLSEYWLFLLGHPEYRWHMANHHIVSGVGDRDLWHVRFYLCIGTSDCSIVGWGTVLQAGRFIGFFSWSNPSSCTMDIGSTQPQTEMFTRNLLGGKGLLAFKADNLTTTYVLIV